MSIIRHRWLARRLTAINPAAAALLCALLCTLSGVALRAAEVYKLGPGDVVTVIVQRHPELSADVQVGSTGRIKLPEIGSVAVTGKTVEQVAQTVTRLLDPQLVHPEVTVILKQSRPRQISILGAVARPGVYDTAQGWRVTEALAVAGGLTVRPEVAAGTLTRSNGQVIPLDLQRMLHESDLPGKPNAYNLPLQPGDILRLESRAMQVIVTGAVVKQGNYDLPAGSGAMEAVMLAGGAAPGAALSKARITHADGTVTPVNLYKAINLGDKESNVKVAAGDVVLVPEATDRVTVRGAVAKPGYYDIPDGGALHVSDAVTQAGNALPKAALTKVVIEHADGTTMPVNLYQATTLGQRDQDPALAPGDVVIVPEARPITILGEVKTPGSYNIDAGTNPRLSDVLAQAGDLLPTLKPQSALISIARTGADGQVNTINVDAEKLLVAHDPAQNVALQPGDLITVAGAASQLVYVSGEVKTPNAYELQPGDGVPEIIARAGGPTDEAALKKVTITRRDNTTQVVDAYDAIHTGGNRPGLQLRAGDFVVVPKNTNRVLVLSAVNKPGNYAMPENETLTVGKAIAMAGGTKDRAKVKEIAVLRRTPQGVQRYMISADQVTNGRLGLDQPLQPGDVVYVPEGNPQHRDWASIVSSLGVLYAIL